MRFEGFRVATRIAAAMLAVLILGACAEINKPIQPNDPWRDRATTLDTTIFQQ